MVACSLARLAELLHDEVVPVALDDAREFPFRFVPRQDEKATWTVSDGLVFAPSHLKRLAAVFRLALAYEPDQY